MSGFAQQEVAEVCWVFEFPQHQLSKRVSKFCWVSGYAEYMRVWFSPQMVCSNGWVSASTQQVVV